MAKNNGSGILDILAALFQGASGGAGTTGGQPMQPQPQMLGNGLAYEAGLRQKLYQVWQEQAINAQMAGQPYPQFEQWVQQYRSVNGM